jgi:hypothetical protein
MRRKQKEEAATMLRPVCQGCGAAVAVPPGLSAVAARALADVPFTCDSCLFENEQRAAAREK